MITNKSTGFQPIENVISLANEHRDRFVFRPFITITINHYYLYYLLLLYLDFGAADSHLLFLL